MRELRQVLSFLLLRDTTAPALGFCQQAALPQSPDGTDTTRHTEATDMSSHHHHDGTETSPLASKATTQMCVPPATSSVWMGKRLGEKRQGAWTSGAVDTGVSEAQPTHSSSTCFIRRDTLPASLVMRVLHRGYSKSMHELVGLIRRKEMWQLRLVP